MDISILGCGWFGLPFAKLLMQHGHVVKGSTTSREKMQLLQDNNVTPYLIKVGSGEPSVFDPSFFVCEVLVIAIPPKVRSSNSDEYLYILRTVIEQIKWHQIKHVMLISSTSVFGDVNGHVNEHSDLRPDTVSGEVLLQGELLLKTEKAFTTTVVRFAGLVGPGRHPGRFFAGKKDIPNGQAPVNLIHLEDCSGICLAILQTHTFGRTIHACAPDHPQKKDFYHQASLSAGLEAPVFMDELRNWKIVDSVYTEPLLSYSFKVDDWMGWLAQNS